MERILQKSSGRWAMGLGLAAWAAYASMTLFGPRSANTYHLSGSHLLLIQLTIILPVLIIWLTAIYGAYRFKQYAQLIEASTDGKALNRITDGLFLLVAALILQTLIGVLLRFVAGRPMVWPLVFLHNHLPLLVSLIGVGLIYQGSTLLAQIVGVHMTWRRLLSVLLPYSVVGGLLGWYLFINLNHTIRAGIPNFTLPGHWPFFTMALPYLALWLIGILSIVNISSYIRKVKGSLYRLALRYFANGIVTVISFTIALQVLTFSSAAMARLNLGGVLALVYLLLIFYAGGFTLIAIGARKLTKIEVTQ